MNDQSQSSFVELGAVAFAILLSLVVATLVRRVRDPRPEPWAGFGAGLLPRLAMFGIGIIVAQVFFYPLSTSLESRWNIEALLPGIVWMVVYETIYRTHRLRTTNIPFYIVLVWLFETPVYIGLALLIAMVKGQPMEPLLDAYSSPLRWLPRINNLPYTFYDLADASLLVGASYFFVSRSASSRSRKFAGNTGSTGYGGIEMSPAKSHTTRFLCASAFLLGTSYRLKVLNYLKDENTAAAPEPGVDLELVAQVCQFAEKRAMKYYLLFPLLLLVGLLISGLIDPTLGAAITILTTASLYFYKEYHARNKFAPAFARDTFDPADVKKRFPADLKEELRGALPASDQNLVVYRNFSPFVGAGISLGGWSFAINVEKPKDDVGQHSLPVRFQVSELYSEVEESIGAAGLSGLSMADTFFVHGSDIRHDKALLPAAFGRPMQRLDAARASAYMSGSDPRIRHYKWVQVHDWGNELVTSYFFRCSLRGSNMFVEINRYLLTPLLPDYRKIDALPKRDWRQNLALGIGSLIIGQFYPLYCGVILMGKASHGLQNLFGAEERRRRHEIDHNPLFNYGSGRGLRESLSSDQFVHYFQKLDGDFYSKVLEHEILDAIVTFLDDHNIDTSELRERQSTILNSGIIVQGGDIKAESLAVGAGSQALKVATPAAQRGKRAKNFTQGAA